MKFRVEATEHGETVLCESETGGYEWYDSPLAAYDAFGIALSTRIFEAVRELSFFYCTLADARERSRKFESQ